MNGKSIDRPMQFVVSTFLLTYVSWLLFLFAHMQYGVNVFDDSPFGIFMLIGLFSPSLMGIVFKLREGSFSVRVIRAKTLKYLPLSFILPILFVVIDTGLLKVLEAFQTTAGSLLKPEILSQLSLKGIATAFAMSIVFGGLEELGWRAYLLPQLLKLMTPLKANLLVAIIWTLWHLPLFYLPGSAQYQQNFFIFMMTLISLSTIMTFLWIKTQSVLLAVICHAAFNTMAVLGFASSNSVTAVLVSTLIAVSSCIWLKRNIYLN